MKDCVFVYRDVAGGREENVPGLDVAVDELGKRGNRGNEVRLVAVVAEKQLFPVHDPLFRLVLGFRTAGIDTFSQYTNRHC